MLAKKKQRGKRITLDLFCNWMPRIKSSVFLLSYIYHFSKEEKSRNIAKIQDNLTLARRPHKQEFSQFRSFSLLFK